MIAANGIIAGNKQTRQKKKWTANRCVRAAAA